jgi:hypothetical protein
MHPYDYIVATGWNRKVNTEMWSGSEEGPFLVRMDFGITHY